jgi:hypothetical protein
MIPLDDDLTAHLTNDLTSENAIESLIANRSIGYASDM